MKTVLADYRESKIFNFCDVAQIKAIEWVHRYYLVLLTFQLFDFLCLFEHRWPDVAYACSSASSQYPSNIVQRLPILITQNSVIKQSISERVLPKKRFYEDWQTSSKSHKVAQNLLIFARESRFCQISINKNFPIFGFSHEAISSTSSQIVPNMF